MLSVPRRRERERGPPPQLRAPACRRAPKDGPGRGTDASGAPGNVHRLPDPRSRGALPRPRSHPEKNYGHSLRPCIAWCSRPRKRATSPGTSLGLGGRRPRDPAPVPHREERPEVEPVHTALVEEHVDEEPEEFVPRAERHEDVADEEQDDP